MNNLSFDPTHKFLNPEKILFAAGLTAGKTVADLGAGSGFYTQAAAKIVGDQGTVYAADVLESALDHIAADARLKGYRNIKFLRCDLESHSSCETIPAGSVDLVIFANIVHQLKDQPGLFVQAYRLLKTGGKVVVVEWNDQPSPIGPVADQRISTATMARFAEKANLKLQGEIPTDPYHYGLMFTK